MKLLLTFLFFFLLSLQVLKAKSPPIPDTTPQPNPVPPITLPLPPVAPPADVIQSTQT